MCSHQSVLRRGIRFRNLSYCLVLVLTSAFCSCASTNDDKSVFDRFRPLPCRGYVCHYFVVDEFPVISNEMLGKPLVDIYSTIGLAQWAPDIPFPYDYRTWYFCKKDTSQKCGWQFLKVEMVVESKAKREDQTFYNIYVTAIYLSTDIPEGVDEKDFPLPLEPVSGELELQATEDDE